MTTAQKFLEQSRLESELARERREAIVRTAR